MMCWQHCLTWRASATAAHRCRRRRCQDPARKCALFRSRATDAISARTSSTVNCRSLCTSRNTTQMRKPRPRDLIVSLSWRRTVSRSGALSQNLQRGPRCLQSCLSVSDRPRPLHPRARRKHARMLGLHHGWAAQPTHRYVLAIHWLCRLAWMLKRTSFIRSS